MPHAERHHPRPVVVRVYVPSPDRTSSTATPPTPPPRQVHFASNDTSSRPLTTAESWSLYNFEVHARGCRWCNDPVAVYKANRQLCDTGNALCADVRLNVYRHDHEHYSTRREGRSPTRLEVPTTYGHTRALLKVMEKQRIAQQSQQSQHHRRPTAAAPSRPRADSVLGNMEDVDLARKPSLSPCRVPAVVVEHSPRASHQRSPVERHAQTVAPEVRRSGRSGARYHEDALQSTSGRRR